MNRLRIIMALHHMPLSAKELRENLHIAQSEISRHLAALEAVGYVNPAKKGVRNLLRQLTMHPALLEELINFLEAPINTAESVKD